MSKELHNTKSNKNEHGSMASYVNGLILSLNLTIIPYLLVVNELLTGAALRNTILVIAVLQMFIQIFFFLHLGRGPKPLYNVVFFFSTVAIIVLTVGASVFIMDNLYRNMLPNEVTLKLAQKEAISQVGGVPTGACNGNKDNYIVTIVDGKIVPASTRAKQCDTITFINKDKDNREIVFGNEKESVSYGGEDKVLLDDGRPETITLNETGYFVFYDSIDRSIFGNFYVEP